MEALHDRPHISALKALRWICGWCGRHQMYEMVTWMTLLEKTAALHLFVSDGLS